MENVLTAAELKRRGIAAIEEGLQAGPVHILKRNKPAAVVLSEEEYQRLLQGRVVPSPDGPTALQWLLSTASAERRSKAQIDADLAAERDW